MPETLLSAETESPRARRARDHADAFDLDNIRVMVSLLQHQVQSNLVTDVVELLHRMNLQYTQVVEKMELMRDSMNLDLRTGLLRYQDGLFDNLIKNAARILAASPYPLEAYPVSYLRLDLDDFSRFNNLYGHEIGDRVLAGVGEVIRRVVRPTDLAIRYGGEEFDIILPGTPADGAQVFAQRFFERLQTLRIDTGDRLEQVTASMGIRSLVLPMEVLRQIQPDSLNATRKSLQSQADDALYEAKALGKARWALWSPDRAQEYGNLRTRYQTNKQSTAL